jgi:small subunit ribosomal protein S11
MLSTKRLELKKTNFKSIIGLVYVNSTFNNTIVTITDPKGNTISWSSSGSNGFKGSRKGTPFAAQIAAESATIKALALGFKSAKILIKGQGSGRETAIRSIIKSGIVVTEINDITSIPYNGCRPAKKRKV